MKSVILGALALAFAAGAAFAQCDPSTCSGYATRAQALRHCPNSHVVRDKRPHHRPVWICRGH